MIISKDEMYVISQYLNNHEMIEHETYIKTILHENLIEKMFYLDYTKETQTHVHIQPSKFVDIINLGYYINSSIQEAIRRSIKIYMQDYISENYMYISSNLHRTILEDIADILDVKTLSNIVNKTNDIRLINKVTIRNALFIVKQYKKFLNSDVSFLEKVYSTIQFSKEQRTKRLLLLELLRLKSDSFKNGTQVLLNVVYLLTYNERKFVYKYFSYEFITNLSNKYLFEFCVSFNKFISDDIKHELCMRLDSSEIQMLKYCLNNIKLNPDDKDTIQAKILLAELHN